MTRENALSLLDLNHASDYQQILNAYKNKAQEYKSKGSVPRELYDAFLVLKEDVDAKKEIQEYSTLVNSKKEKILLTIDNDTSTFGTEYLVSLPKTISYMEKTMAEINEKYKDLIVKTQNMKDIDIIYANFQKELICTNKNFIKLAFNEWCMMQKPVVKKENIENSVYSRFNNSYSKAFFDIGIELTTFLSEITTLIIDKQTKMTSLINKQFNSVINNSSNRFNYNQSLLEPFLTNLKNEIFNDLNANYLFADEISVNRRIMIGSSKLKEKLYQILSNPNIKKENGIAQDLANKYSAQYNEAVKNAPDIAKSSYYSLLQRIYNLIHALSYQQKTPDEKIINLLYSMNLKDITNCDKILLGLENIVFPQNREVNRTV